MDSSLLPFFQPKGVVIVGASILPEKPGYGAVAEGRIKHVAIEQGMSYSVLERSATWQRAFTR